MVPARAASPLPGESRDEKDPFHPRELLADADASAAAKWEVGELRTRAWASGVHRSGSKRSGSGKYRGSAVNDVLAHEDNRSRRGIDEAARFERLERTSSDCPCRW